MKERKKKESRGVGLIEALVAASLVTLAALQSISTFFASEKTVTKTGQDMEAVSYSQATLEELTAKGFDGVAVGAGQNAPLPAGELRDTFHGSRRYTVEEIRDDETGDLAYKKITATTTWISGDKPQERTLVTMLSKPDAYNDNSFNGAGAGGNQPPPASPSGAEIPEGIINLASNSGGGGNGNNDSGNNDNGGTDNGDDGDITPPGDDDDDDIIPPDDDDDDIIPPDDDDDITPRPTGKTTQPDENLWIESGKAGFAVHAWSEEYNSLLAMYGDNDARTQEALRQLKEAVEERNKIDTLGAYFPTGTINQEGQKDWNEWVNWQTNGSFDAYKEHIQAVVEADLLGFEGQASGNIYYNPYLQGGVNSVSNAATSAGTSTGGTSTGSTGAGTSGTSTCREDDDACNQFGSSTPRTSASTGASTGAGAGASDASTGNRPSGGSRGGGGGESFNAM